VKRTPRQVRLEPETEAEIQKISEVTDLPQVEIIRQTIKAGVAAIKANNYKLPLPLSLKIVQNESLEKPQSFSTDKRRIL